MPFTRTQHTDIARGQIKRTDSHPDAAAAEKIRAEKLARLYTARVWL